MFLLPSAGRPPRHSISHRLPRVSIVVPLPPGMKNPACLGALANLDYPEHLYEVIVAYGRSPSRQRNLAAGMATGEILFFLDDDSVVDRALLRRNVSFYGDASVACVGGPNIETTKDGVVGKGISAALASAFGDYRGCKRFACRGKPRTVTEDGLILCNVSIRKELFDSIGGFPEQLYPNEENALFSRLARGSGSRKLMYVPEAFVRRARPTTIREFTKKIFGYGAGRLNQTFVSPSPVCALRLLVAFWPLYLALLPFVRTAWFQAPLGVYFLGALAMAVKVLTDTKSVRVAALTSVLIMAMHMSYSAGILWGLAAMATGLRKERDKYVELVHFKRFDEPLTLSSDTEKAKETERVDTAATREVLVEQKAALQATVPG